MTAYIIHGWEGFPEDCWIPWLKSELEKRGVSVVTPAMPNPSEPTIKAWVDHLTTVASRPDEQTFFVGHSLGCQTILRYLERLPDETRVGGTLFVAGFFKLTGLETAEEKILAKPWLETPMDFEKIKRVAKNITGLFSDNDESVPVENAKLFEQHLGAKTIIEHNQGHFDRAAGIYELPEGLHELEKMMRLI